MDKDIFLPADILIPSSAEMEKWSVIACDQFTSDRDYWERVDKNVGDCPSTLRMIVPEAFLGSDDTGAFPDRCAETMREYLSAGIFKQVPSSFIYVERETSSGIRKGLVGAVDLDSYDFTGAPAPVLATEATVVSRLPARIAVRRRAALELPHVMMLIDDPGKTVIEPLGAKVDSLCKLYDFDLMEGGGRVRGWRVTGDDAGKIVCALRSDNGTDVRMVVGDGNHSLAAAKSFWDDVKCGLSEEERSRHPSRYALVEVNNIHDPAIEIEPIHRVVFEINPDAFLSAIKRISAENGFPVVCISGGSEQTIYVPAENCSDLISRVQDAIDGFIAENGGNVDYIHGDDTALTLAEGPGTTAVLLPSLDKSDLFRAASLGRTFPRKSFSIGQARDKRYYLECRKIV